MELVAGYPYSLIKSGLPYQYPKLLENARCETAIIGGGISGALTAYHLINAGFDCILVDGRAIGLGSTCASTSLLQYELDTPLYQLKKLVGEQQAVRSYQLCGEAVDKLIDLMNKIGFKELFERRSLFFSTRSNQKKFMLDEMVARRNAAFEVELLSAHEMQEMFSLKAICGILSSKGATTNAYALTHEILQHCKQRGLRIYDRTKIKKIDYKNHSVVLETEDGCRLIADYVVNSTGYEVVDFIKKGIVDLDSTYAIISEAQPERKELWNEKVMMWNTDDPYLYLCMIEENRLIIGGRDEAFTTMKTLHTYLNRKANLLEKDFSNLFPRLPFKKEFAWSGVFGKTKDSLPYIGTYAKTPRTFYALGFGGNGITFSLVAAEIITDLLMGKKNRDAELFSFSR